MDLAFILLLVSNSAFLGANLLLLRITRRTINQWREEMDKCNQEFDSIMEEFNKLRGLGDG